MTNEVARTGNSPPLFARARYNNAADSVDELTFFKDEILQVMQKDHNGQVDWWLCQLRGKIGMVPANYLEIFHPHAKNPDELDYDFPKNPKAKAAVPKKQREVKPANDLQSKYADLDYDIPRPHSTPAIAAHEEDIYDHPPCDQEDDPTNRDYDLPPEQDDADELYDRPPSGRSSRSGFSRLSGASMGSSGVYDLPPSSPGLYDVPPQDMVDERQNSSPLMDVAEMYENEAEELLSSKKKELDTEFDNLWKCVYGNDAYWGSENKTRRRETVKRTVLAAKKFDGALSSIIKFGKGVSRSLENSKDANFKRKFTSSSTLLSSKRQDILAKIDILVHEDEKDAPITTTVKLLLEVARSVPQAVHSFTILIMANRVILFKTSTQKSVELIPVSKQEVKVRPLPELPDTKETTVARTDDDDYAIADDPPKQKVSPANSGDWSATLGRRRNPQDVLPPLPFATLRKVKGPNKAAIPNNSPPVQNLSLLKVISHHDTDYDDIDAADPRPQQLKQLTASNFPSRAQLHRQSSGSTHSVSSDDSHNSPRRGNSPTHMERSNGVGPYGYITNTRSASPLPLRQEDRDALTRYSLQMDYVVPSLGEAMECFITSIKNNESPRDFVTKSKMVVVAAYKLVYIADALYQRILHNDTKTAISSSSNNLTETIKALVSDTKTAALQHPSVIAMTRMLESLRKLYPTAIELVDTVKRPPAASVSLV